MVFRSFYKMGNSGRDVLKTERQSTHHEGNARSNKVDEEGRIGVRFLLAAAIPQLPRMEAHGEFLQKGGFDI